MLPSRADHRRPRGQAPFPPLHGICSDPNSRSENLWGVPGARRLCGDSSSLLGKGRPDIRSLGFPPPPAQGCGDQRHRAQSQSPPVPTFPWLRSRHPGLSRDLHRGLQFLQLRPTSRLPFLCSQINVILGAHNVRRLERTQQRIPVLRAIPHPRYNPHNYWNDIMLLQLRSRARRNRAVRPVALPQTQSRLSPGTLCTVAGWGLVGLYRRTDTLQDVWIRVQRGEECSRRFTFYTGRTQICVGDPRERKSAFLGDSGGPLVCNNVAQGIVSYGNSTGTPPAVFTRISSFLPWIRRTMRRCQEWGLE
ncbi:cathepsin G-like isoform X1 [Physeter macrocephalus]|uniref:Cathepsin G-like isoform X1 n=1 Tax=Physeter macrocephalus TaxID=9755 RepID=A0A455C5F2_PHYMC|nr:cathepsin G-like isoform X1 [Physeter catodon]|eukprot:XP_028351166.1 cathepsin G-like isoform X1 [Physeter catodon]